MSDGYDRFPPGFFDRADDGADASFYEPDRFVTHIDDGAIAAVGALYDELGIDGRVLDLCSSWVSHFAVAPEELVALGMNAAELDANPAASTWVVHDLNAEPRLPFGDGAFDDVARVLTPGGRFVCTFSNRCFPTKAIRGWLATDDDTHCDIVATYFALSDGFDDAVAQRRTPPGHRGDPLYAVWATRG